MIAEQGSVALADLDAVTVDAFGTLIELIDPVAALQTALAERGVERTAAEVEAAFRAEVEYYVPRSHEGRDEATLALLRRDCAGVFLEAARAHLPPERFADAFVASLRFAPLPGASAACRTLRDRGLRLAVVSNWDAGLREHLAELDLLPLFDAVVTSAEAGAAKPDPRIFEVALGQLGTSPRRTLHVGDSDADRDGARAAGLRFAEAPLTDVVQGLA
jgi:HAD superfamily hydrolase (TIGR01509 family)